MRDGLPSLGIRCIFKDSRGLLWLGTDAGLCSFDGRSFRIYKPAEGMTASQIWAIAEDGEGNMWFGSYGNGLYKYNGRHFVNFTANNGITDNKIRVMYYSKKYNLLMIGGTIGLTAIQNGKITPFLVNSKNQEIRTITGFAEAENYIYIYQYSHTSPLRFYPDKKEVESYAGIKNYYSGGCSCFISSKGDTVFTTGNYGVTIFRDEVKVKNDTIGQVFGIDEDKNGNLWFAVWAVHGMLTKGGIVRYDGKTFKNYNRAFGITDNEIWSVMFDDEQDILWIGTLNDGLYKVPFSSVTEYPPGYFNLQSDKINYVYLDSDNKLWVSYNKELLSINPDSVVHSFIPQQRFRKEFIQFWNHPGQMPFRKELPFIYSTLKGVTSDYKNENPDKRNLVDLEFNSITESRNKEIIFQNNLGTYIFNKADSELKYLGPESVGELSVNGDTLIYANEYNITYRPGFYEDRVKLKTVWGNQLSWNETFFNTDSLRNVRRIIRKGNRHWIASGTTGLWIIEGVNAKNISKNDSTISNSLNDICFDNLGNVIFGSNTGEIYVATLSNDSLKISHRINNSNGLHGNSIFWLATDKKNHLWAGTNLGLHCIQLDSLYSSNKNIIRFFDEEEGYTGQAAKHAVIDKSNNLWLGDNDKLIKVNTGEFRAYQPEELQIELVLFEINHIPSDSLNISGSNNWEKIPKENLRLKFDQNNLDFYFDVVNYLNPQKDRFRYRLEGYDKQWSHWSASRRAVYTSLPPGKYKLFVESYNLRTLQHCEPLIISFIIRQPWWGLWYLQLLASVIVLALAGFIVRKYYERKRRQQLVKTETEKKIAELEMQALQAQMNPHFIFNTINGIQSFILGNKTEEVLNYISDFSRIVRFSLENASSGKVSLEHKIAFLNSYLRLEQMRFSDKFEFEINTLKIGNPASIHVPPMLVQPFVENAIRHGFMKLKRKGRLLIEFELTGTDILKCTITDNGVGREKARNSNLLNDSGNRLHSLQITGTRLNLYNTPDAPGKYHIDYTDLVKNGKPAGLKVEIYMPADNF